MHEVKTSENGRDIFFERTKETGEDKLWEKEDVAGSWGLMASFKGKKKFLLRFKGESNSIWHLKRKKI